MKKIAFDLLGNDQGIKAGVEAVKDFLQSHDDYSFILIGDEKEINKLISPSNRVKILHQPQQVDKMGEIRQARNKPSSMVTAINLVAQKEADVVISSGNSGVYLSLATLILKRLPGIKRPAFMPVFPTIVPNQRFVLADVGANLETTSTMLVQWALLGNIFAKIILNKPNPRVGIVNIGTEANKGKAFHREADELLRQDKKINYQGFVEPRELLNGVVDVSVIDGYGGNMVLKSMEGTVISLLKLLKSQILSKIKYKIGYLMAKGAFDQVRKILDYRNVGSAWLIGLNGLAIKCHGGADKQSYLGAFGQIHESLSRNLLIEIKNALDKEKMS